jgi:transposase
MDRAYEGEETREAAKSKGHEPIVPPRKSRMNPWIYDKEKYKKRNMVERFFRRIKEFRKVCTRYDKTDIMYLAFVNFACIAIWLN